MKIEHFQLKIKEIFFRIEILHLVRKFYVSILMFTQTLKSPIFTIIFKKKNTRQTPKKVNGLWGQGFLVIVLPFLNTNKGNFVFKQVQSERLLTYPSDTHSSRGPGGYSYSSPLSFRWGRSVTGTSCCDSQTPPDNSWPA